MKLAAILVLWLCGIAAAQPSGGSIGGGGWSGGGDGGGGVGGVGDAGGEHAAPARPPTLRGILLLASCGVILLAGFTVAKHSRPRPGGPRKPVRVSALDVALGPEARAAATTSLRALAGMADASTAEGRAALVHEVALLLRRHAAAAAYVASSVDHAETRASARRDFERRALEARSRFTDERIRNHNGVIREPARADRADDTAHRPGFTVVTLLLASRHALFESVTDRASLTAAINALANTVPGDVIAAEIVWMPADAGEPLSSLAVEARVPDVILLDDAIAGPLACTYCSTRYAAEQLACPRCGAYGLARGASGSATPA